MILFFIKSYQKVSVSDRLVFALELISPIALLADDLVTSYENKNQVPRQIFLR